MFNVNRANLSDCNLERVPSSNKNRNNTTRKPKPPRSKYAKINNNRPPSCNDQISEFSTFQWNQSNRLYPTMSDSAMCGYPIPFSPIPVDTRFHTLYPVYPSYVPVGMSREYMEPNQHVSTRDQFTSLPPINIMDNESEIKRTHSDPGLNNLDDKFELNSSESDQESYDTCYTNEVAELKKNNQKLANELELVKIELRNLKLEISSKNIDGCVCADPGSITNMIQEIRTAHKLMEQTLESKLDLFNANKNENFKDNSQILSIHERLEKLEKAFVTENNTKLKKKSDLETGFKNNTSQKKSSNHQSSVVTAL